MTHNRPQFKAIARYTATTPLLGLFLVCNAVAVAGTPVQSGAIRKRDGQDSTPGMTPKIWVPVVVAAIIIFALTLLAWSKTSWRRSLRLFSFSGAAAVGGPVGGAANTGPRELTAEQLAGTINGDIQTGAAAARTTRRPRRPRRTPSQMSVTSLPAYNKEPGEEELVIFRGRDAEDATMPTAVAMTSLDEERDESSFSHDNAERYSPMPTSPHDMPLLQDDAPHGDLSLQSIPNITSGEDGARPSVDAGSQSSHETSSLMRTNSNLPDGLPDPRGEAPAYYEVVDPNELQHNRTSTAVTRQPSAASRASRRAASPPESTHPPGRRSGFRTLLNRMSMSSSHHHSHNRNESLNSTFSSNISHGAEASNGNGGAPSSNHRTTPSGSGSLLSVNMFRTISRQRSNHTLNSNRLNSPSLISLNSISAPLTHTVTRSEFTYPKSGPTAEQLKVISSRESFARFGVPYGADAIAYASSSRLDLLPPPDFASSVEALVSSRTAGSSRLRSASNAHRIPDSNSAATTSVPGDNNESGTSLASTANIDPTSPASPSTVSSSEPAPAPATAAAPAVTSTPTVVQNTPNSTLSQNQASLSAQPRAIPVDKPAANADKSTSVSSSKSAAAAGPSSTIQPVSEFGKLSAPPSSYHELSVSSVRSESRASVFTFATAQESLSGRARAGSVTDADEYFTDADAGMGDSEFGSAPSTPRMGGQHVLDLTDATIVPDHTKRDTILASSNAGTSGSIRQ